MKSDKKMKRRKETRRNEIIGDIGDEEKKIHGPLGG